MKYKPESESFSKEYRLLKSKDFDLMAKAEVGLVTSLFVVKNVHKHKNDVSGDLAGRLGCAISRKAGNAVCRNAIKRKLRERFRRSILKEVPIDLLVIGRSERIKKHGISSQECRKKLNEHIEKLFLMLENKQINLNKV